MIKDNHKNPRAVTQDIAIAFMTLLSTRKRYASSGKYDATTSPLSHSIDITVSEKYTHNTSGITFVNLRPVLWQWKYRSAIMELSKYIKYANGH